MMPGRIYAEGTLPANSTWDLSKPRISLTRDPDILGRTAAFQDPAAAAARTALPSTFHQAERPMKTAALS